MVQPVQNSPRLSSTPWVGIEGEFDGKPGKDILFARAVKKQSAKEKQSLKPDDFTFEAICVSSTDRQKIEVGDFLPVSTTGNDTAAPEKIKKYFKYGHYMHIGKIYSGSNVSAIFTTIYHHSKNNELIGSQGVGLIFDPNDLNSTPVLGKAILQFEQPKASKPVMNF